MKCTRCGYTRQKNDDNFVPANECPSCGIAYDKNPDGISNAFSTETDVSEPVLRPSPVDAESLKKARERVDKRLNERLAAQNRNSRHDQTLELARRLASEGVRKRQEQWKQQQMANQEEDTKQTALSTESTTIPDSFESEPSATHDMNAEAEADTKTTETKGQQEELADAGANSAEILDMEAESKNAIEKSWVVPSRDKTAESPSGPVADSPPEPDDQPQTEEALALSGTDHQRRRWRWIPGGGLSRLLPFVAWLILVAGISGAVLSWTTLTEAEAGMQTQQIEAGNSMNLGLLLGFAYLVTGVLGFAFFWVSSLMSRQLKEIRRLLLLQPISQGETMSISHRSPRLLRP